MAKILTFGVYDYFHIGHLRLFKQCKEHADFLVVAVQDGDYILKFKPDAHILYSTEYSRNFSALKAQGLLCLHNNRPICSIFQ